MKPKSKSRGKASPSPSSNGNTKVQLYEYLKAALPATLSPIEYQAACHRIARDLKL